MLSFLAALGLLLALCRFLKAPRGVYIGIVLGASILVMAARFLLPAEHPFRLNRGQDLDGLVVLIVIASLTTGYVWLFRKLRTRSTLEPTKPVEGFVLIEDDEALARDVEALLTLEPVNRFSVLRRSDNCAIAASGRATIRSGIAELGPLYPFGDGELLATLETECLDRGATSFVVGPVDASQESFYVEAGYSELARIGERTLLKKDPA
jgi:hypothetical protein